MQDGQNSAVKPGREVWPGTEMGKLSHTFEKMEYYIHEDTYMPISGRVKAFGSDSSSSNSLRV